MNLFEKDPAEQRELSVATRLSTETREVAETILLEHIFEDDSLGAMVAASRETNAAMDELLARANEDNAVYNLDVDFTWLHDVEEDKLISVLKSTQSKRSRLKVAKNTENNYLNYMGAAIAEQAIRNALGDNYNQGHQSKEVDYTPQELEELANDQEKLKKEIRNIQSKKSIMKHKQGFDPSSDKYQNLLKVERILKDLRHSHRTVFVDETKKNLQALFSEAHVDGQDLTDLSSEDIQKLLTKLKELV